MGLRLSAIDAAARVAFIVLLSILISTAGGPRRVVIGNGGGGLNIERFGGMPVNAWFAGEKFKRGMEMREFTCPAWWYQSDSSEKKPDWDECSWGSFSSCEHFKYKHKCWDRFDGENPNGS